MEEFSRHMESSGGMGHVLLITKRVEPKTQTKKNTGPSYLHSDATTPIKHLLQTLFVVTCEFFWYLKLIHVCVSSQSHLVFNR